MTLESVVFFSVSIGTPRITRRCLVRATDPAGANPRAGRGVCRATAIAPAFVRPARSPRGPGTKHDPPRAGLRGDAPPRPRPTPSAGWPSSIATATSSIPRPARSRRRSPAACATRLRPASRRGCRPSATGSRCGPDPARPGRRSRRSCPAAVFHPPGRRAGRGGAGRRGQRRRRLPRHRPDWRPQPPPAQRYLTLAWEGSIEPVVVLNKADVCPDLRAAVPAPRQPRRAFRSSSSAP